VSTDARQQSAQAERSDHVIVSTRFQRYHPIDLVATMAGHDDHRYIGSRARLAQQIKSALLPQMEVEV
jgi:hypothetical protein